MKRLLIGFLLLSMLAACWGCGGNTRQVEMIGCASSQLYSERDIQKAADVVKDYFKAEFDGCTLTQLRYPGDEAFRLFDQWAEQYGADEAIVLYSSFNVDDSGGDGSLNPNSTYDNYAWILVRNQGGSWEHKTHGYG